MSLPKKTSDAAAKLDKFRRQAGEASTQDGAAPHSQASAVAEADTATVLETISTCQATLTSKIDEGKVDISLIRQDMRQLQERVGMQNQRHGGLSAALTTLHGQFAATSGSSPTEAG